MEQCEQSNGQNCQKAIFKVLIMWRDRLKSSESKTWQELLDVLLAAMRETNNSDAAEYIRKEITSNNVSTSQMSVHKE